MIGRKRLSFVLGLTSALVLTGVFSTKAWAQKEEAKAHPVAAEQPLYSDYKGVRLNMSGAEVREKLGKPTMADDDQDYYIVSPTETIQIAYDAAHKAKAISVDFVDGVGAPDYQTVVGPDIETAPDGSQHKMVIYKGLGFWVSFHRSAGPVRTVSVTIQKLITQ